MSFWELRSNDGMLIASVDTKAEARQCVIALLAAGWRADRMELTELDDVHAYLDGPALCGQVLLDWLKQKEK